MRSNIARRITVAVMATLMAPMIDKVLDGIGISEEDAKLLREVIKAVIVTAISVLIDEALSSTGQR